jgi:hypothetical protein
MNLQQRIDLMVELGNYMKQNGAEWQDTVQQAYQHNPWLIPEFINTAASNIVQNFLNKEALENWAAHYRLDDNISVKNIGVVMAGNIPMVGFHDFLTVFISGHDQTIKLSSKDDILLKHLVNKLYSLQAETKGSIRLAEILKGCDAYIATGSNNSSRYFEQYFSKYPHIIRRNRTSVAILDGEESTEDLENLSDDIHLYFGLGCRNVTKIFVPEGYDFVPLLQAFNTYRHFSDHHKYNNNYDYQLAIMLMNNVYYMTNGTTLLMENPAIFSAISVLNYEFYKEGGKTADLLKNQNDIQCIVGKDFLPFGQAQDPGLFSYADGIDTMQFLLTL